MYLYVWVICIMLMIIYVNVLLHLFKLHLVYQTWNVKYKCKIYTVYSTCYILKVIK